MNHESQPIEATRLTPEEEAALRHTPLRTVRAREIKPALTPAELAQTRWRAVAVGATVAVGAGVAAAVGYLLLRGRRTPRARRSNA